MDQDSDNCKAWILAVGMGYGHQRTAYPLRGLAFKGEIIRANHYPGMPTKDRDMWKGSRSFYEFMSNFQRVPLIGRIGFKIFDAFQRILKFYPRRDLSKPDTALKTLFALFEKDWGKDLIEKLKKENSSIPLISTFFISAFMAEFFNYPEDIYCVICDADISRTWASLDSSSSRIKYFAPNERVVERLKLYGVKEENIFLTGYPLPLENIGSENFEILKHDLSMRILNLDPKGEYLKRHGAQIKETLGNLPEKSDHPLTILFSIGGAGAQRELGMEILKSLSAKIKSGEVKVIISAGIKEEVREYLVQGIKILRLEDYIDKYIEIIFEESVDDYFEKFNQALRKTDILWTKPSELSFYSALGLPIIIAPTIGSQEEFNRDWLLKLGAGILQDNPEYTNEWLFDLLDNGQLAEAAIEGFIEGEKLGTLNIKKIISKCPGS